ncbi:unnamed protein product [Cyprideis torosa]|uniref:Uncharacterized protein n=1 Tax=Cyprideis torosa TaxID=163714 RepID=A0A7R8W5N4_9CRUS|nr:unnamed protein product [Cyprideis torosa]CAG0883089.1 unnamed protein product [Cyprideis torosa]
MSSELASIFLGDTFSDLVFYCVDGSWARAHTAFMAQMSPVVKMAVNSAPSDAEEVAISLPDFSIESVNGILELCYLGHTYTSYNSLQEMVQLSDFLQIPELHLMLLRARLILQNNKRPRSAKKAKKSRENSSAENQNENDSSLVCTMCQKKFCDLIRLLMHQGSVHQLQISCPICHSTNFHSRSLKQHMERVHSNQNFPCKHCNRSFGSRHLLWEHEACVHRFFEEGKGFPCTHCNKEFTRRKTREHHLRFVHGIVDICRECPTCGKLFTCRNSWYTHRYTHIEERRFPCDVCGKHFKSPSNLRSHLQLHCQSLVCPYCTEKFNRSDYLVRHLRRSHDGRGLTPEGKIPGWMKKNASQATGETEFILGEGADFVLAAEDSGPRGLVGVKPLPKRGSSEAAPVYSEEDLLLQSAVESIHAGDPADSVDMAEGDEDNRESVHLVEAVVQMDSQPQSGLHLGQSDVIGLTLDAGQQRVQIGDQTYTIQTTPLPDSGGELLRGHADPGGYATLTAALDGDPISMDSLVFAQPTLIPDIGPDYDDNRILRKAKKS